MTSCQAAGQLTVGCSIKQPLFILIMKSAAGHTVASLWLLVKCPFSSDNLSLLTFFWPAVESSRKKGIKERKDEKERKEKKGKKGREKVKKGKKEKKRKRGKNNIKYK